MNDDKIILLTYRFVFSDMTERIIALNINSETLTLVEDTSIEKPEWTKSEFFDCKTVSCGQIENGYCPIALILNRFVKLFSNLPSYEKVTTYVESNRRIYSKETSLQEGFGSLLGIMMPTSGCPTLGKLKPLAKFHLPFASIEETEFRVFSMYLLAQYVRMQKGLEPDWEMKSLKKLYDDIQTINRTVARKIADLEKMDASINSVIVLNNFADSVTFSLEENLLHFEKLFDDWLDN